MNGCAAGEEGGGVTDLAPELTGWYGTSSINPKQPTTLFLLGNHFGVHQTQVIAGGQLVPSADLLSRQVMKVTIPSNPILVSREHRQETQRLPGAAGQQQQWNWTNLWTCNWPLRMA